MICHTLIGQNLQLKLQTNRFSSTLQISMNIRSILVLLSALVTLVQMSHQTEAVELDYSESLLTMIRSTISGCTISIYLNQLSQEAENNLINLASYHETANVPPTSFFLNDFQTGRPFHYPEGNLLNKGKYLWFGRSKNASWQYFQKHSLCYSQIYFLDSEYDLNLTIFKYFVITELHKLSPKYVFLWDNGIPPDTNWKYYFNQQEFYGSLMDYRFYIGRIWGNGSLQVYLICIPCSSYAYNNPNFVYLLPTPTPTSIHETWIQLHRNLNKFVINFHCRPITLIEHCERQNLFDEIAQFLNASIVRIHGVKSDTAGFITDNFSFSSTNIGAFFTAPRWPNFHIVGLSISHDDHFMITVSAKSHLLQSGLNSLLSCFESHVLVIITICVLLLTFILFNFDSKLNKSFSLVCFYIFSPMVDRWHTVKTSAFAFRFIFLWSLFCYSLTCIYSGEMASSLSVLEAPAQPNTLMELGTNMVNLHPTLVDNRYVSHLGFELQHRIQLLANSSFVPKYISDIFKFNP